MKKVIDGDHTYIVTDEDAQLLASKMPNACDIKPTKYKQATHTICKETLEFRSIE